jgi:hypothetical protein
MLGNVMYFIMQRPYLGKNRQEIREQILARQAKVEDNLYGWSSASIDFVNRLLIRKSEQRLGHNGLYEVKSHPWFKDFNWTALLKKNIKPPFVPGVHRLLFRQLNRIMRVIRSVYLRILKQAWIKSLDYY